MNSIIAYILIITLFETKNLKTPKQMKYHYLKQNYPQWKTTDLADEEKIIFAALGQRKN